MREALERTREVRVVQVGQRLGRLAQQQRQRQRRRSANRCGWCSRCRWCSRCGRHGRSVRGGRFVRPALLAHQRHEPHAAQVVVPPVVGPGAGEAHQPLLVGRVAHRHDQPAAHGQLPAQCGRDRRAAGGHQDRVERGGLGPAECAVAGMDLDVGAPQRPQPLARRLGQPGVALDRVHAARQPAQHGGGVARAGAHFQHAIIGADVGGLGHQRHDVGLRHRLACFDRHRRIVVGVAAQVLGHEPLARHLAHGVQHAHVGDAAARELVLDHLDALAVGVGHGRVLRAVRRAAGAACDRCG